jgi:hypothetical protein
MGFYGLVAEDLQGRESNVARDLRPDRVNIGRAARNDHPLGGDFAAIRAGFDQNQCERSGGRSMFSCPQSVARFCRWLPSPTAAHEPACKCKVGLLLLIP